MISTKSKLQVSLKRILWATDFSLASEIALPYALTLARQYGSKLYFAHIVESDVPNREAIESLGQGVNLAERNAKELEASLVNRGALSNIPYQFEIKGGDVGGALSRIVEEEQIDLLVLGTNGRTGLKRLFLGSVAAQLFRRVRCQVLTVGPRLPGPANAPGTLKKILFPTDFSSPSIEAVPYALSLAEQFKAQLTLLHVLEEIQGEAAADVERVLQWIRTRLRELVEDGADLTCEPQFLIGRGSPAECILEVAEDQGSDLIVLGVRWPGRVWDRVTWPHAYRIASESTCPVLTVRANCRR